MKNFIALIFAALIANSAFATWITPVETATCTRDYNAWGHAGKCECPHATRYERALGQCVQGAPIDITVDGVIATEVTFVGEDEIKSFVLTAANKDNYELVLSRMLKAEIEEFEAQGLNYRITGEVLETYDASEIVARPKIIVATVEVLATFRDAPEITIAE